MEDDFFKKKAKEIYMKERSTVAVKQYLTSHNIPEEEQKEILDGIYAAMKLQEAEETGFSWGTVFTVIFAIIAVARLIYKLTSI